MNSNKNNKRTYHYHTRGVANSLRDDMLTKVLTCVLRHNVLHWSDGLALARTSKRFHTLWKTSFQDTHFSPLLEVLEGMVGVSGCDEMSDETLRNDLLDPSYPSFSVTQKCQSMVVLLQIIIGNMQSLFFLDDPSNRAMNDECDISGWTFGFEEVTNFFQKHDRRSALAVNIAIFGFALSAMKRGGDFYFNDVFLGKENASLGGGSYYGKTLCSILTGMLPLRDEDLVKTMRANYPSSQTLEILRPALIAKVVLMAPFFRWVPPGGNDGVCLESLPTPLEPMDETIIRAHDMERWLQPHDGIDY